MAGTVSEKSDVVRAVNCFLGHLREGEKGRTKNASERRTSFNTSFVQADVPSEGEIVAVLEGLGYQ